MTKVNNTTTIGDWIERGAELLGLIKIASKAPKFYPPFYIEAFFGPWDSWFYPYREYSEFNIIDPQKPAQTWHFLRSVMVPSLPYQVPPLLDWLLPTSINDIFWRTSDTYYQHAPECAEKDYPNEKWFFINGICTDKHLVMLNALYLAKMFHRPITVLHNITNSVFKDLLECVLGKGIKTRPDTDAPESMTEATSKSTAAIVEALNDPAIERVVVIAHSQGTIILANVIRAIKLTLERSCNCSLNQHQVAEAVTKEIVGVEKSLINKDTINRLEQALYKFQLDPEGKERPAEQDPYTDEVCAKLAKFEVYAFANCATTMEYISNKEGHAPYPYIESFANYRDIVARLGVISPQSRTGGLVKIDGPVYLNSRPRGQIHSCWGHLLNQHYLYPIDDFLCKKYGPDGPYNLLNPKPGHSDKPRLYGYFKGELPDE